MDQGSISSRSRVQGPGRSSPHRVPRKCGRKRTGRRHLVQVWLAAAVAFRFGGNKQQQGGNVPHCNLLLVIAGTFPSAVNVAATSRRSCCRGVHMSPSNTITPYWPARWLVGDSLQHWHSHAYRMPTVPMVGRCYLLTTGFLQSWTFFWVISSRGSREEQLPWSWVMVRILSRAFGHILGCPDKNSDSVGHWTHRPLSRELSDHGQDARPNRVGQVGPSLNDRLKIDDRNGKAYIFTG